VSQFCESEAAEIFVVKSPLEILLVLFSSQMEDGFEIEERVDSCPD
jgi:hypothetical protein